ncbi:AAA family ATPase [Clavibacter tessellarius]
MRIGTVRVKNYRSLVDVTVEFDEYGALIGANGSGKSSVLYALDWFFNGTPFSLSDIHGYRQDQQLPASATIEVAVTFEDLTTKDRERLQQYGRGSQAHIRRTWYATDKTVKTIGNATQGPEFASVRAETAVGDMRTRYAELRTLHSGLPELGRLPKKDEMLDELLKWEQDSGNASLLIAVEDSDATQMLGWNGPNVLKQCVRFVLVPAATSITAEVGSVTKGNALTELVGAFMSAASTRAQAAWLTKHAAAVSELATEVRKSIEASTGVQTGRINARLASFVPNAKIVLTPNVPEFAPKVDPTISTAVSIDGFTNDVSQQGHGVQRAVMMSMFQAVVPDEALTRSAHTAEEGKTKRLQRRDSTKPLVAFQLSSLRLKNLKYTSTRLGHGHSRELY